MPCHLGFWSTACEFFGSPSWCALGEEIYTLRTLWDLTLAALFPECRIAIIGTDVDEIVLSRAGTAYYEALSLREP